MEIKTNISKNSSYLFHDVLKYPPIEQQVFELLASVFPKTTYEIYHDSWFVFILNGTRCRLEVLKKGVRLQVEPPCGLGSIYFGAIGDNHYPLVQLPYNTDVTKRVNKFCETIHKLQDLEQRARSLPAVAGKKKIDEFLRRELATDQVTASYCPESLFDGSEIGFYLHLNAQAPADGTYVILQKDTNQLIPLNGWVVGRPQWGDAHADFNMMKQRVEAIEHIKAKAAAFDPSKSAEFMHLLEVKRQADELVEEFKSLSQKKP